MAHGITNEDSYGEVRSNGKRAWHGLGTEIPDGLGAVEGFPMVGVGWPTELLPVYADRMTPAGVERIEDPNSRMHVRGDTGAVLGMVGARYPKFDNMDLARFADGLLGADAAVVLETAGSLHGGKRVFCTLRLPQTIVAAGDDRTHVYVVLSTGHGGNGSLWGTTTAVRAVCANTAALASQDVAAHGFRFVHAGDLKAKLETGRLLLGYAQDRAKRYGEQVAAMVARKLTGDETKQFMADAFEAAFPAPDSGDDDMRQRWLKKRETTFEEWRRIFASERNNGMAAIRGTTWAALNTVTEWHDHARGRTEPDSDSRVSSNLFGASAAAKAKTLKLALALAGG